MKVFIDGNQGTTGLKIHAKLAAHTQVEMLRIPDAYRKDASARKDYICASDVTFLCLPDQASREAVALADGKVKIIDASTAHRTDPGWSYGFPELSATHRQAIVRSGRVAVPGCHASGFQACVYPLRAAGLLGADAALTCFSLTGYSGGGKSMIADYGADERDAALDSPRQYGIAQTHKHLPEMQYVNQLTRAPLFCPIVADYYSGMQVTVPLSGEQIGAGVDQVYETMARHYAGAKLIRVQRMSEYAPSGFVAANAMAGSDAMRILVGGNDERILVCALFDNLGKGASGAAVQCMNIMFGLPETLGLEGIQ